MITDLLSADIKKIIYLDSDTIINLDVNELWQIELGNKVLATISEFENGVPKDIHTICRENLLDGTKYFNAGVLLINLLQFKKEQDNLKNSIKFIADNPKYECFDQDILNHCFLKRSITIPKKFNVLVEYARMIGDFNVEQKICHYITSSRGQGFGLNTNDPYNRLFIKYFSKTPWFNEETLPKLYGGVQQLYIQQKKFAVNVSEIMSGKTRAFFVQPDTVEEVKRIFRVKPNEEMIAADSPASLQTLINSLKNSGGKKIFFLLLNEYYQVQEILTRAGFTAGKDFINAVEFLSDAEGVPLNSYQFIKIL